MLEFFQLAATSLSSSPHTETVAGLEPIEEEQYVKEMDYFQRIFSSSARRDHDEARLLAAFAPARRKKKKGTFVRKADASAQAATSREEVNGLWILGAAPRSGLEVGEALHRRILVLSSFVPADEDPNPISSPSLIEADFDPADDWSYESAEDTAALYRAGSVISVHPRERDTDDRNIDQEEAAREDDRNEEPSEWTQSDIHRHQRIAAVVSDWLHMLSVCSLLPN